MNAEDLTEQCLAALERDAEGDTAPIDWPTRALSVRNMLKAAEAETWAGPMYVRLRTAVKALTKDKGNAEFLTLPSTL